MTTVRREQKTQEIEEVNEAIIRLLMSEYNDGNLSAFFNGFADHCIFRLLNQFDSPLSWDAFRSLMLAAHEAFPKMHIDIQGLTSQRDIVSIHVLNSGKHEGAWKIGELVIPATQKQVAYREMVWFRLSDRKIVEWIYHPDIPGLLQQLGVNA